MPTSTPIAAPGILRTRRPGSTRTSPPSWSARPAARGREAAWRRGRHFTSAPSNSRPIPGAGHSGRCARQRASTRRPRTTPRCSCWRSPRQGPLDELEQARAQLLHAQITFAMTRGRDAPPLLLQAAKRRGQAERGTGPLAQLAEIAHAVGTDWALGTHARAAATLAEGEAAERLYREAIERLSHVNARATLARAHLLYGEWLRREHRRVNAREQLRVAYTMLSDMGMEAFAERAGRELLATGETVRKRTVESLDELTPRRYRSRASPPTGKRTRRSPPSCSSARARLSGT